MKKKEKIDWEGYENCGKWYHVSCIHDEMDDDSVALMIRSLL